MGVVFMELKNRILYSWLGPQLDFKHKLLNLILITTFLGGFASFLVSFFCKMGTMGNIVLIIYLLVSAVCFIIANYVHKPNLAAIITVIMFDIIACPILYFEYGGLHSGTLYWTVLGLAAIWFVLPPKQAAVLYLISLIPNLAVILLGYKKPELINNVNSEWLHMLDVLMALVFVSFITGLIYMFQTREYEKQRKRLLLREETLHQALEDAAEANRAKSNFLATMSHDIRTPLNAIIGFTRIAEKNFSNTEKVRDCLLKTKTSSNYLLSLINDVLDMSRIESGQMKMELFPCNLEEMAYNIQELFANDIKNKNIDFTMDISTIKHNYVLCDELRLIQIFTNLMSNAVKYTNEYGNIKLIISESPEVKNGKVELEIVVQDTGIGMTKEFQKVIFDSYSREMTNATPGTQGSGLGMAITKAIVNLMGGTISVRSLLGQGSTFTVKLLLSIVDKELLNDEPKNVIYYFDGKRILLAEDNLLNQEIATAILHEYGMITEVAKNGMEAFDMVRDSESGYYDAIIMDIQMPIMNGYEATQAIRDLDDEKNKNIPIIAMTAHAFEDDRQLALKCGMNGHVAKPIEIPKLMDTLNSVLS